MIFGAPPSRQERTIRTDPRSPFVLSARDLSRRPGTMRTTSLTVAAPERIGTAVAWVEEGADLHLDLRLEAVMEGVLVTGSLRVQAAGECVRCLGDVQIPVDTQLMELFAYPDRAAASADDDDDEVRELGDDDTIDLESAVRDAVVLALPFQPVCRPDCPGLCADCGALLADHPDHSHETSDPRWDALRAMLEQDDSRGQQRGSEEV